jgi:integrase
MASVERRDGRAAPWQVRYRDPEGNSRSRQFARKVDAQRFLVEVEHGKNVGGYVDPAAGKVTFGAFAEQWLASQTFDVATRVQVESRLRVHVLPTLGDMELRAIRPSTVQAWVRGRADELAPGTVKVLLYRVAGIFGAAVEDGLIVTNPCASRSVSAPRVEDKRIIPWTAAQVRAVVAAHPDRYRAVPIVAAGCGLRQGEVFGLRVSDVVFLRHRLHVRQQVKLVSGHGGPFVAPPKRGKLREVPLADTVAEAVAEHLRVYPAGDDGLVFADTDGGLVNRDRYNRDVWKPALVEAGMEPTRANGMHALRHYFASVLLDAGESVRALAEYLGHTDPGFTLRTYAHMLPASEDRTRRAVDAALSTSRVPQVSQSADS